MTGQSHRFVILGGGTAGWMAACLIAHRLGHRATVTLIEAPEIGIIGVGEGSTPQMKAFFDELGIDEAEWMPRCNATYKTGIRVHGWSDVPGYDCYFHPFQSALDSHTAPELQQTLSEPFESFAGNLFNDAAVATPAANPSGPTSCETGATALSAGWAWRIPLINRTGNGYVYSSRFIDADAAETELRRHLGLLDAEVEARHLKMKVGQVRRSWVGNCLAVGLAQGFIEPLEATALHIVLSTVSGFVDAYAADGFGRANMTAFNARIHARYEGIRDYIVCHYRMNRRSDGEYWRANAVNQDLSDNLKAVMTCWFQAGELDQAVSELGMEAYYAALSWHCLLAGYGQFPDAAKMRPPEPDLPQVDMDRIDDFVARCALNFVPHDQLLARLQ